jgi:hypothetical protein
MKLFVTIMALAAFTASAQSPAGWQTAKDRKQLCQMNVPAGWTADRIMASLFTSPDKKSNVLFSSKPAGVTYADIAKMAKDMFKPVKTFEDTGTRVWFVSTQEHGKIGTTWYVALNTNPVCEAQIQFQDAAFEATAKQMIASLKSTK